MTTLAERVFKPSRVRIGFEPQAILYVAILAILVLFILYPAILIVVYSFHDGIPGETLSLTVEGWQRAVGEPNMRVSIYNTIKLLFTVQIIALPIGVFVAWLLARTDMPGRHWLEFMFWISFFIPSLSVVMGWVLCLDPQYGLINKAFEMLPFVEKGPFDIYSFGGIVWTHLGANAIAVKVMLLTPGFRNMDASHEEASRISGANRMQTLTRIVVPAMLPAILVVEMLAAIRSMQAFEIEVVLGPPFDFYVYSTKIFNLLILEPPDYAAACALAVMGLLIILPFIYAQRKLVSRRHYTTVSGKLQIQPTRLGRWKYAAFALVFVLVVFLTFMPVVFSFLASFQTLFGFFDIDKPWTINNWVTVFSDDTFAQAMMNTLMMSAGAGLIAVVFVSLVAYYIVRSRYPGRALMDFLSWLPFAIPGILFGLGLLMVFLGHGIFRPLYGTIWLLIFASVVAHMTLGTQIVRTNMMQLGAELEEASRISGGDWFMTFRRIVLPIIVPVCLLVGVLNFIVAARDVSTVALLASKETRTLSLLQLDYMMDGNYEPAAVVSIFVIALTTGIALIARAFGLKMGIRGG
jgi:iron(III) transport system permease protein